MTIVGVPHYVFYSVEPTTNGRTKGRPVGGFLNGEAPPRLRSVKSLRLQSLALLLRHLLVRAVQLEINALLARLSLGFLRRSPRRFLLLFLPLHRGHDLDLRQGALLALLRPALVQETLAELHVALVRQFRLVRVEELASAHELVDDEVIVGIVHVLVEVEGGLEVDGLGLGDVRRAHFADAVGVVGGGGSEGRGPHGGGGGGGGPNLFKGVPGVQELSPKDWKTEIVENTLRRNKIVVFYTPGCATCDDLKEGIKEFVNKFVNQGLIQVSAVNCGKHQNICQKESTTSLPAVMYYGPGDSNPQKYAGSHLSYKSLSSWVPKVMGDKSTVISQDGDLRKWLSSDDKVPHVVFFSDRKSTPPLMKALSLEFEGRAALGVVLAGADKALVERFGIKQKPALVHVLDEDSLQSDQFDKDFQKESLTRFLSRAVGKHRSGQSSTLRELTPSRFSSGDCAPQDPNFCLLLISSTGDAGIAGRTALRQVAQRLRNDPVKAFFVRHRGFVKAFGKIQPSTVLLYRPKRKRFKLFAGDASNSDEVAAFVDSTVHGGTPLPEILSTSPHMHEEL